MPPERLLWGWREGEGGDGGWSGWGVAGGRGAVVTEKWGRFGGGVGGTGGDGLGGGWWCVGAKGVALPVCGELPAVSS